MHNKELKRQILEISYKNKLSHLGSCLTAVDIIKEIYLRKKPGDKFILSCGHAHLAHAVVMEAHGFIQDAEKAVKKYGIHCDTRAGCDVTTGSLGQGLPIALGMALADRSKGVHCLISDGERAEGSIDEALRICRKYKVHNLHIYVNYNGWGAYDPIASLQLPGSVEVFHTQVDYLPFLKGQDAHYHVMSEDEYKEGMRILK